MRTYNSEMMTEYLNQSREIKCINEAHGKDWWFVNADAVELSRQLPSNSVGFNIHSPPFSTLYTYSDGVNDMGNCLDDAQFFAQYRFLIREQLRVMQPGRLVAVHCKDLVDYQSSAGRSGLRDFPGEIVRIYEEEGFKYQSRVTIWKCPVTERARTNAHGLLFKTLRADASFVRVGLPEYVLLFRKWPRNETEQAIADANPIRHWNPNPKPGEAAEAPAGDPMPLETWQQWASPVWMDIDQTDVLNVQQARADKDEKHMCPLQLDLIERSVVLWSMPGDVVWSPFGGIGSEGVGALKRKRKYIASELKPEYWKLGCQMLTENEPEAKGSNMSLFDLFTDTQIAPQTLPPKLPKGSKRPTMKVESEALAFTEAEAE
jgi:DNA modification methylase